MATDVMYEGGDLFRDDNDCGAASVNSAWMRIDDCKCVGIMVTSASADRAGTVGIQFANAVGTPEEDTTLQTTVTASSAYQHAYELEDRPWIYLRVTYTRSAGTTGTIAAVAHKK